MAKYYYISNYPGTLPGLAAGLKIPFQVSTQL